ncbi:hypothetical protein F4803DRAFT_528230 [Xylaria telfairii]|nr:hypothetical protein F4803DRAFT_528230 [Xylaria telfairii]
MLGTLNVSAVVTQQEKNKSASIRSNDILAPCIPDEGAAGVRKGNGDVRKKRKKNRRVENAKKVIRDYGNGKRSANLELSRHTLYLSEYRQLLEEIEEDDTLKIPLDNGLRYDYTVNNRGTSNKQSKQFVVRMPTAFHERLSEAIDDAIKDWRKDVRECKAQCVTGTCSGQYCTHHRTIEIAENLMGHRSESVHASELKESDKKDPDLSYAVEGYDTYDDESGDDGVDNNQSDSNILEWPALVVEIGWSQTSSELQKKCEWYIKNSHGKVRTVIGVDLYDLYLCYPKPKTQPRGLGKGENNRAVMEDIAKMVIATKEKKALGKIFVWRAEIDSRTKQATAILDGDGPQIFRDEDGKPAGEVAFRLTLEDFISPTVLKRTGQFHNPELAIMSAPLCKRFELALKIQIPRDRDNENKKGQEG